MIVFGFNGKSQESSLRLFVDGDHLRAFIADYGHRFRHVGAHACVWHYATFGVHTAGARRTERANGGRRQVWKVRSGESLHD